MQPLYLVYFIVFQIFDFEYSGFGDEPDAVQSYCSQFDGPVVITSSGNAMSIGFLSDDAITGGGFIIQYFISKCWRRIRHSVLHQ